MLFPSTFHATLQSLTHLLRLPQACFVTSNRRIGCHILSLYLPQNPTTVTAQSPTPIGRTDPQQFMHTHQPLYVPAHTSKHKSPAEESPAGPILTIRLCLCCLSFHELQGTTMTVLHITQYIHTARQRSHTPLTIHHALRHHKSAVQRIDISIRHDTLRTQYVTCECHNGIVLNLIDA